MNPALSIRKDLTPFFSYTTFNPSCKSSYEKNQKVQKIYQNCVACNQMRFNLRTVQHLPIGTNVYFCDNCAKRLIKVFKRYESKCLFKENKVLREEWEKLLFTFGYAKL